MHAVLSAVHNQGPPVIPDPSDQVGIRPVGDTQKHCSSRVRGASCLTVPIGQLCLVALPALLIAGVPAAQQRLGVPIEGKARGSVPSSGRAELGVPRNNYVGLGPGTDRFRSLSPQPLPQAVENRLGCLIDDVLHRDDQGGEVFRENPGHWMDERHPYDIHAVARVIEDCDRQGHDQFRLGMGNGGVACR